MNRLTLVMTLTVILCGCRRAEIREKIDSLRGPGIEENDWTRNVRRSDPVNHQQFGVSNKARQIEDNLGIR